MTVLILGLRHLSSIEKKKFHFFTIDLPPANLEPGTSGTVSECLNHSATLPLLTVKIIKLDPMLPDATDITNSYFKRIFGSGKL